MDFLIELRENYANVRKLLEEDSKNNLEKEPYKFKYEAKIILLRMKEMLTNKIESIDNQDPLNFKTEKAKLAIIVYQIGLICFDTEEPVEAEKYFKTCYDTIVDHLDPLFVLVSIHVRNQLGILWSQRSQPKEALNWLKGAETLYTEFKTFKKVPKHFHDHFEETDKFDGGKELETIHTLTNFYLAQVYGVLKDLLKSSIYCHETLQRQLNYKEYDSVDWALNSATLSQFFMEKFLFKQARHHLAAASYILDIYEESLSDFKGTSEEMEAKKEELLHRSADVSRCWAKYGIFLLEHSKNRLTESGEQIENKYEDLEKLFFYGLNCENYEQQVMDCEIVLFEDARDVFLFAQNHVNRAKKYYSLEDRASDYVQIIQDHSQLFRHLSAFEKDEDRQCKILRKRIDMLDSTLKELNPKYYLNVCRQLWFELGEIFHDLMHLKYQKIKDDANVLTPQALKKINKLAESSMLNFNNFLDSVNDKKTEKLPEVLPDDLVGPVLIAHFYLGRLHYKYLTPDKVKQIENTTKSYECFKYVVDYCEKSQKGRDALSEELNISKEMMKLLEIKILQY